MLRSDDHTRRQKTFDVLLTAEEAYPALEREFLDARTEIWASFRVFDPTTRLRSEAAREFGETWTDLIMATLQRGVVVNLIISDFDPIVRPELHSCTWKAHRLLTEAADLCGVADRLRLNPAMHQARTGLFFRCLFWPAILHRQFRAAGWLNRQSQPDRASAIRDMPGLRKALVRRADGRFRPRLWPLPKLCPATHHQKLAVFDRKRLYIGGLDLDERRYDSPDHTREAEQTWHDVQLLLDGPAVREAQDHLESFLDVTSGIRSPAPGRRLVRTMSRPYRQDFLHMGPEPVVSEIAVAHEHLARRTKRLIYVETQFFRDVKLAQLLARRARDNPDLGMILILPGAPEEVAFERRVKLDARYGEYLQSRALKVLREGFGNRLFVGGAAQQRRHPGTSVNDTGRDRLNGAPIVYIHAKVSIFDDTAAIVSSANLNGRSLRWDTEAGLFVRGAADVGKLRHKVMSHWLPETPGEGFFDPLRAVPEWRRLAQKNARRRPDQREGFLLPYDMKAAEEFATDVGIIPDEMV
ncbi:phospholipase D1/2 [Cribrihabitans marinus]|uniref:Phospholipase D n=1 Tax=Cribrihabitans marinus TaxID=1227549 RepID=A0A1H7BEF5_9RHOB|nr:phospholipase D-like domain-containing protein [Cribrihabitans marinus]GGH34692.1 hypothetical protein GCM10010973_27540 [Cribrihabitans marinus]SEJ76031.1 phospholipase D1/2 [Cribrihabitans marinus]